MLTLTVLDQSQHRQSTLTGTAWILLGKKPPGGRGRAATHKLNRDDDSSTIPICHVDGLASNELDLQIGLLEQNTGSRRSISLVNRGRSVAISNGPRIHRGRRTELALPVTFCVGQTQFQLVDAELSHPIDQTLTTLSSRLTPGQEGQRVSPAAETLAAWLETLSDLQQVAAGSQTLLELAAQAVFNPGGLDGCLILEKQSDDWEIVASHIPYPDHGICYRQDLVQSVANSGDTIFHDGSVLDRWENLDDTHTAVVTPVIDPNGETTTVVYGFRSLNRRNLRKGIRFLEAQFVQVIADSLSAGMIRLESEAEAARSLVLLEQAFPPRIARQLATDPKILAARQQEVTVLFADLRGFSAISERVGADVTFELLADVMDNFGQIVTDLDGTIIDFYGDGISAFWNAPITQPEHPRFACHAATLMLEALPGLNAVWQPRLGQSLGIGVGIHTGVATVGNSGSRNRLKYGPRGTVVNLASRLESLTRELGVQILVSEETADRVRPAFPFRHVSNRSIRGHQQAMSLWELVAASDATLGATTCPNSDEKTNDLAGERPVRSNANLRSGSPGV